MVTLVYLPSANAFITKPMYRGTTNEPIEPSSRKIIPQKNRQDSFLAYTTICLNDAFFWAAERSGTTGFTSSAETLGVL